MFKRVITLLFCLLLVFVATFGFIIGIVTVPTIFSYAADQEESNTAPPGYTQVSSNNELGEGFLAYCKSRDSEITSSVVGATVTSAYDSLAKFCRYAGFNVADLQSHLWYLNQPGQPTKWFFDSTGINLYNRAFAYLIQENDLEVGDVADDVSIYNGEYFTTDNGYTCLVYVDNFTGALNNNRSIDNLTIGSKLMYTGSDIISSMSVGDRYDLNVQINNNLYQGNGTNGLTVWKKYKDNVPVYNWVADDLLTCNNGNTNNPQYSSLNNIYGEFCIFHNLNNNTYYVGFIGLNYGSSSLIGGNNYYKFYGTAITPNTDNKQNVNVIFTTNNTVINNNVYEGDTIINDYGDVITEPDNPDLPDPGDPTIPYNPYPDNPNYDPNDPNSPPGTITQPINPSDPNGGDNVNIDFPDFDLDLPEINWSLGDLSHKFPFSIPFDMVSLVRVLDAPAEAPRFQGTVNFGFTTWDYDINLDQFSSVAAVCRIVETLLFVFGLILITRNLIKG